jgi:hypothetical protein
MGTLTPVRECAEPSSKNKSVTKFQLAWYASAMVSRRYCSILVGRRCDRCIHCCYESHVLCEHVEGDGHQGSGMMVRVSLVEEACTTLGSTIVQLRRIVRLIDDLTLATAKQLIATLGKYWLIILIRPTGPNTGEPAGQASTLSVRLTSIATYLLP